MIKSCPFCGKDAEQYSVAGSYGYYASKSGYRCSNSDCKVRPSVSFDDEVYDWGEGSRKRGHYPQDSKGMALKEWNKRV